MNIPHQPQGPDRPNRPRDLGREGRERLDQGGQEVKRAREASQRDAANTVERVREARLTAQERISNDLIELSPSAQNFDVDRAGLTRESATERAERIAELKQLALEGKLNTPERAEKSAAQILNAAE